MPAPRILLALSTCNRPVVTGLCLQSLQGARSSDLTLVIYDDASTAYTKADLLPKADEVVRFHRNGGIERSRARAFRDFLFRFPEHDLLYLTDNDTLHDPSFVSVLQQLFLSQQDPQNPFPICLYNSRFHAHPDNLLSRTGRLLLRRTAPGVSQAYSRSMVRKIVDFLDHHPEMETVYGWDYLWPAVLNVPFLQTDTSYLEHFARDRFESGLHSSNSGTASEARADFERDRALNPTPFLQSIRDAMIEEILGPMPSLSSDSSDSSDSPDSPASP
jgi:hypothetical protein